MTDAQRYFTDQQLTDVCERFLRGSGLQESTQEQPTLLILGGPAGSRKTTLRPLVADQLGLPATLHIDGDDLYELLPGFAAWARTHGGPEAHGHFAADFDVLYDMTLARVRGARADLILVGPYTNPDYTFGLIDKFRTEGGYRVEMAYTALHPALSQLGVMYRHAQALQDGVGYSITVALEWQRKVFENTPRILTEAEGNGAADALHLVAAEGIAFSKTRNPDGTWSPPQPAADALDTLRTRPWTPEVQTGYTRRREAVAELGGDDWPRRLRSVDELAAPMLPQAAPGGRGTSAVADASRIRSVTRRHASSSTPSTASAPQTTSPGRHQEGRSSQARRSR